MKKFFILINRPQCTGSGRFEKIFLEKHPETFFVSKDKIKWLISDYKKEKYSDTGALNRMLLALTKQVVKENLSVILETTFDLNKDEHKQFKELAEKNKIKFLILNIEVPLGLSLARFRNNMAKIKESSTITKVSNKSEKRFFEIFNSYDNQKKFGDLTLDLTKMDELTAISKVEKLLEL